MEHPKLLELLCFLRFILLVLCVAENMCVMPRNASRVGTGGSEVGYLVERIAVAKKLSKASTDLCLPADCTELQSLKIISSAGAVYFSRPFLFPLARTVKLSSPPLHWKKVFQGVRFAFYIPLYCIVFEYLEICTVVRLVPSPVCRQE